MSTEHSVWVNALLATSGVALVGVDLRGRTVFWSAGAEALFGWTREEVMADVFRALPSREGHP